MSHVVAFASPPGGMPTQVMPGGALLGNGDVGVTMAGPAEEQQYYIGKNDLWRLTDEKVLTAGHLTLSIPSLKDATYRLEQDMDLAEVRGIFSKDGATISTRSWVAADENLLLIELRNEAGPATEVSLTQGVGERLPPLIDNAAHLNIGREQYGGGRWYFHRRLG